MKDKHKIAFYAALVAMALMALPSFAPLILIGSAVWFAVYKLLEMDIFKSDDSSDSNGSDDSFDSSILFKLIIDKLKQFKEMLENFDTDALDTMIN